MPTFSRRSWARPAVSAMVGVAIAALLLLAATPWDADGSSAPYADQLPLTYSVQARAQTPAEAALTIDPRTSPWVLEPASVRVAQSTPEGRLIVGTNQHKETCIRFETTSGGTFVGCGTPAQTINEDAPGVLALLVGGISPAGKSFYLGLVPDGLGSITADGESASIKDNTFLIEVGRRPFADVALIRADGTIWRQFELNVQKDPAS